MTISLPTGPAGVRQLIHDLRAPLPDDFVWDFSYILVSSGPGKDCGCALGYAYRTYVGQPRPVGLKKLIDGLLTHLEMDAEIGYSIFCSGWYYDVADKSQITPAMVADALANWLRSIGEAAA